MNEIALSDALKVPLAALYLLVSVMSGRSANVSAAKEIGKRPQCEVSAKYVTRQTLA